MNVAMPSLSLEASKDNWNKNTVIYAGIGLKIRASECQKVNR